MKKKEEPEEEDINEMMYLIFEAYRAFNSVLKHGTIINRVMAVNMMNVMHQRLKVRLDEYVDSLRELDVDDKEVMDRKEAELTAFHRKSDEIKDLISTTEKLMEKHYPIKTKSLKAKRKRKRINRYQSKKIRD